MADLHYYSSNLYICICRLRQAHLQLAGVVFWSGCYGGGNTTLASSTAVELFFLVSVNCFSAAILLQ